MATDSNPSRKSNYSAEFERFDLLIDGLDLGIWDWDLLNEEMFWSPKMFRILGYDSEEIEPSLSIIEDHLHPDDINSFKQCIRTHFDHHNRCAVNCRFRRKEGRYRWFRVGGQAIWNEEDKPTRFVGSIQDIRHSQGEDKYKSLVAATKDWVWEYDLDSEKIISSNNRVKDIFGYSIEEFCQFKMFDLLHPEDRKEFEGFFPSIIAAKEGWTNRTVRIRAKDGNYRYVESSSAPVLDDHGEVIGFHGIDRDITERRLEQQELSDRLQFEILVSELSASFLDISFEQVEEEIDRALKRLADFFDLDQCAIVYLSTEGNGLVVSQEFVNRQMHNKLPNPIAGGFDWTVDCLKEGQIVQISGIENLPSDAELEKEYMLATGVQSFLTIPTVLTEQIVGGIYVADFRSCRNWTSGEIKRLRFVADLLTNVIVREQQEMELESTRSTLMASVDSSPAGIVIADAPDGKIRIINRAAIVTPNETSESIAGTKLSQFSDRWQLYYPNGDPYKSEDLPLARAILHGETLQNIPVVVALPNGERRWLLSNAAPVLNAKGKIIAGVTIYIDITDLKNAEVEREKLIRELEDKNAELERFTYTVSHDLKSPLITIKGFLGLLLKEIQSGEMSRVESRIQKINAASDQMSQLLEELLELSRIGRLENAREWITATDLAQQAVVLIESQIEQQQVKVEIDPEMPQVFVDRIRMVEVFQNLLDNAVRFASQAAKPWVRVGSAQQDGQVVFFVVDNGAGIDPAYHEKVFGLFEQLQPDLGGTGIGLAIVKRIVEVHGGTIWIESDGQGNGSKICFTIQSSLPSE